MILILFIVEVRLDNLGYRKELLELVNMQTYKLTNMSCQLFMVRINFLVINYRYTQGHLTLDVNSLTSTRLTWKTLDMMQAKLKTHLRIVK